MHLFFLRHGKAEEVSSSGNDFDRRLTPEGIQEMQAEAAGLLALGLHIDSIFSSPLRRALETATIVAKALDVDAGSVVVDDRLAAGTFDLDELEELLRRQPESARLLLVGHEPSFSGVVGQLVGNANLVLKKGGLAYVETAQVRQGAGVLRWLLTPRHLIKHNA
jgi:phosphohistidine phosphatase